MQHGSPFYHLNGATQGMKLRVPNSNRRKEAGTPVSSTGGLHGSMVVGIPKLGRHSEAWKSRFSTLGVTMKKSSFFPKVKGETRSIGVCILK